MKDKKQILVKIGMYGNKHHIVELLKTKNPYWPNGIRWKTLRSFVLLKEDFNKVRQFHNFFILKERRIYETI